MSVPTSGPSCLTRDYAKCGWLLIGIAAFFSIAPARGIAAIVLGLLLGAAFSFLAYGAARCQRSRLAAALFLTGLLAAAFFCVKGPAMMEDMRTESLRRQEARGARAR